MKKINFFILAILLLTLTSCNIKHEEKLQEPTTITFTIVSETNLSKYTKGIDLISIGEMVDENGTKYDFMKYPNGYTMFPTPTEN